MMRRENVCWGSRGFLGFHFPAFKPKSVATESPWHLRKYTSRSLMTSGYQLRCGADEKPWPGVRSPV